MTRDPSGEQRREAEYSRQHFKGKVKWAAEKEEFFWDRDQLLETGLRETRLNARNLVMIENLSRGHQ